MTLTRWLNASWMLKAAPEAWAFARATQKVAPTQAALLLDLLARNRDTDFGRRHCFDRIRDVSEFQQHVPLSQYADYRDCIERIAKGEKGVLTSEPVLLLEPTSGTTAGEKLIPYTAGLRRQFQRGIAAWLANLFWHRPAVRQGKAYWSISPALGAPRRSAGGIPIGFDDDAAYLGTLERLAMERLLAASPSLTRLTDIIAFRYCTLLALLRAGDLALISVWNPTYLTALFASLGDWQERLVLDIRRGTASPPTPLPLKLTKDLRARPDQPRARRLAEIFASRLPAGEITRALWPRLALISCWTDAAASEALPPLRDLFPGVEVQGKGLLATEGFISFPRLQDAAPALAVRSHFFEFQEADERGRCHLAHALDRGGRYRVVLTTAGGLYRYDLRDLVEVVGFEGQCPLLRFLGKADNISDLVGEKLSEAHVRCVLEPLLQRHRIRFALLAPAAATPPFYQLYLQGDTVSHEQTKSIVATVENGLCENPHYSHALRLGQLAPLAVRWLSPGVNPQRAMEARDLARGCRLGDIKPRVLDRWAGWNQAFGVLT